MQPEVNPTEVTNREDRKLSKKQDIYQALKGLTEKRQVTTSKTSRIDHYKYRIKGQNSQK